MKEYTVVEASKERAETVMNAMASQGWVLHSVTYWSKWGICLLLTFERDR